jgi:hypothetical protein
MRRRSSCAAASGDGTADDPVIGKVLRGRNVARLLYYLYGPGKANEHTDPHLVAGFADPADLEPERRRNGSRDFRRLAGLLNQPLAALAGPGFGKPVWHCAVRAAPDDRMLSDAEWAQVAAGVMDRTGLAPDGDELGVRWVAVRHAADHIHLVATLARQDGRRPNIWNDFYRVRQACRDAEAWFGLADTAPADRTAARRPGRAEAEQAARRGWGEAPRARLCREVATAAAGAGSEQEFFARLAAAGVEVRKRYSTRDPGQVTGYAVGLPEHTAKDGGIVWYGGGKLAADLSLPKLRRRWSGASAGEGASLGHGLPPAAARAVLRAKVSTAARQAADEAGFFTGLRVAGVQVRLRFSEVDPGEVTGYSVSLPGHLDAEGATAWYGGGRLSADLTLSRLRRGWDQARSDSAERSGAFRMGAPAGTATFSAAEREAIYAHAARTAAGAAEHIRRCAHRDPAQAADAAWAAADTLHVAARALRNPALRRAADSYGRAARARYGRIPPASGEGAQLRAAARLLALAGMTSGTSLAVAALIANLAALAIAVAELRAAQQRAAQAAAARAAAGHLRGCIQARPSMPHRAPTHARRPSRPRTAADLARGDFPMPVPGADLSPPDAAPRDRRPRSEPAPSKRAGPRP